MRALLERFESSREAERAWGRTVARQFIRRVGFLMAAEDIQSVRAYGGLHLHALSGDRRGSHAIRLTGNVRLILEIRSESNRVVVKEVTDYHG
jgi:plasmid maintenance system killer protein